MMQEQRISKQALLVIGMHRSGTSALTRVLDLHGAVLGTDLPGPARDNETGFWENRRVVDFHNRLLASLDSSWDDPRELRRNWLDEAVAAGYLDELIGLLNDQFGDARLWAVKDPRLCRLLPLFLRALARLQVEPKLVFALRDPGEVVGSLLQRNGLSAATAALLWLRHLNEPVLASRALSRCVVEYDKLLKDWCSCMTHISSTLAVTWPISSSECATAVEAHLRGDLRHQHAEITRDLLPTRWRELLMDVHAKARALAHGEDDWAGFLSALEAAMARFEFARPLIADLRPTSLMEWQQEQLAETMRAQAASQSEAALLHDESAAAQQKLAAAEYQRQLAVHQKQQAEHQRQLAVHQWQQVEHQKQQVEHQRQQAEHQRQLAIHQWQQAEQALEMARTKQVELQGEIVKRNARITLLEQAKAELELIKASRSWRWTRPWRFAMRSVRQRDINALDRKRLRQLFAWRQPVFAKGGPRVLPGPLSEIPDVMLALSAAADTSPGGAIESTIVKKRVAIEGPALQSEGCRDYFIWAVIDWHFRTQRPQHLSRELVAAGHRVFYISNNFVDDSAPGFAVEPLDNEGMLFQVHFHLRGAPQIYHAVPNAQQREQLRATLGELLAWSSSRGCVALVQHPYWLETARILPDAWLVYDCMDHHGGFADNDAEVLAREDALMREADLLIVTSEWLYEETGKCNRRRLMVRNACQYEHFARRCADPFKDPRGRKVIGYYGAIAEWFDLDLVEKVAKRFADCLILLVGNDTVGARGRLACLPNVEFTGEVPYASLPAYLDGFDVCILPFQVIPLTLATNPVKVYEYLSAGKDVVSVSLPEIRQFGDLVRIAEDHDEFVEAVTAALQSVPDPSWIERRQYFAAQQTWSHRAHELIEGIKALRRPRVSVIVVTYNNLDLTKVCLASVEQLSDYDNMEVIVIDNASTDGTPDFLREWARDCIDRKIILNSNNLGFAAGNNLGLAAADGEYLVLLNNDTYVTFGWIATLMAHLRRDEKLGMVGPVTNNIGNEARIDIHYHDMDSMLRAAAAYTARHVGQSIPLRTAAFFCVMMRRAVYERVGLLDEAFGIGFFEDDDYCRRVEQAGWAIACAEDVFVHHHLSASFNKLKQEKRQAMFEQNKTIYEAKWGTWEPHKYRQT